MKNRSLLKRLSILLVCMLFAGSMFTLAGCKDKAANNASQVEGSDVGAPDDYIPEPELAEIGTGSKSFYFTAVDKDGFEYLYKISTDKSTVGEALLENDLIAGEESDWGLYVKTVNGITADYDVDGTYWAFYIGDEYASNGVDQTEIKEGETYILKVEK